MNVITQKIIQDSLNLLGLMKYEPIIYRGKLESFSSEFM